MSINTASRTDDNGLEALVVAAPRKSDAISGALRAAFGQPARALDDFAELLRRIDQADQAVGNC